MWVEVMSNYSEMKAIDIICLLPKRFRTSALLLAKCLLTRQERLKYNQGKKGERKE